MLQESDAELEKKLELRTRELTEALEHQRATTEVLRVISSSPGAPVPVFDAILASATRICEAQFGILRRYDGGLLYTTATRGCPPAYAEHLANTPMHPPAGLAVGKALLTRQPIQVADAKANKPYLERNPEAVATVELGGARTLLAVPMLKDGEPLGTITVYRQEVRPFTDKQIELLVSFASEAVIAIAMEKVRLLNELRSRTNELAQSVEELRALGEVSHAVNSTLDLEKVLETIVAKAVQLSSTDGGSIWVFDGLRRSFVLQATYGVDEALITGVCRQSASPGDTLIGRAAASRVPVQVPDLSEEPVSPARDLVLAAGFRAALAVPLLSPEGIVGMLVVRRRETGSFATSAVELLQTFAAQSVSAIQNARLFREAEENGLRIKALHDKVQEQAAELARWNRTLEERVEAQSQEIERISRLKRFLAPQLAEVIVSSGDERLLESHRRGIAALFCDLRGFTAFAEADEPEEVMALLRSYHQALGPLIHRFEGTLDHFAGDGLMVFFNDPVPCADASERAVRLAIAMREAVASLAKGWRKRGHQLGFGVGIAEGFATLGRIGFEEQFDYTAIGTVCNLATRLCDEAKDGEILISAPVAGAVEDLVELKPMGAIPLKGISRAVTVSNVLRLKSS
jgi:class 3 adenylate cyclase/putative methionine-R-sulfoxide reductase with GAF domain